MFLKFRVIDGENIVKISRGMRLWNTGMMTHTILKNWSFFTEYDYLKKSTQTYNRGKKDWSFITKWSSENLQNKTNYPISSNIQIESWIACMPAKYGANKFFRPIYRASYYWIFIEITHMDALKPCCCCCCVVSSSVFGTPQVTCVR